MGLRYDVEVAPLQEVDNPAFSDPGDYPVDTNNIAPRIGFTYSIGEGRSVLRGGCGLFYDKTHFELICGHHDRRGLLTSFTALFPATYSTRGRRRDEADQPDAGQRSGRELGRCSKRSIRPAPSSRTREPSSSTRRTGACRTRSRFRSATSSSWDRRCRPAPTTSTRSGATSACWRTRTPGCGSTRRARRPSSGRTRISWARCWCGRTRARPITTRSMQVEKARRQNWSTRCRTRWRTRAATRAGMDPAEFVPAADQSEARVEPGADRLRPPAQPGGERAPCSCRTRTASP